MVCHDAPARKPNPALPQILDNLIAQKRVPPLIAIFVANGGGDAQEHDWVEANNRMAKVLKAKGYEYQYLFCRNAPHSVGNAQAQYLPHAIEWMWRGYAPKKTG